MIDFTERWTVGTLGDAHPEWLAARLADLDAGDIETLVTETERLHPQPPDDIAKALAYFKTNAHRMRYAYFREHGLFVGSGVVEAGCKAIVGQRLKLSGMRWNLPGAPPCAASRPATASTTSGHSRTARSPPTPPHDQPASGSFKINVGSPTNLSHTPSTS